jgi:hypothetical protein
MKKFWQSVVFVFAMLLIILLGVVVMLVFGCMDIVRMCTPKRFRKPIEPMFPTPYD